jgi:DNA-binding CsgD family transcriptional regulator
MERGFTCKEIGVRLQCSERTVVEHRRQAMRRTQSRTIAQLMAKWGRHQGGTVAPVKVLDSFGRVRQPLIQ